MRSGVRFWGATTTALAASGAANSADLEPAVQLPSALWSWSGGYIGGHVGVGYGQKSFNNPYGPSVYGGGVDTPVFLAGGQIGYNWQKNSWVFGLKLDASGAVSNGTDTCLAASGTVMSANCKASPNVFVPGAGRLGYAFGAEGHTLAYLKGGVAWQSNQGDGINNNEFGRCRRRRARRLQGARLSRHTPPAMLGAQDCERPGEDPLSVQATMKKDLRKVYWARTERPPKRRLTSSPRSIGPSTAGRSNAWSTTATHCWPSTIFLPNIGITCIPPPISSRAYSPRGDTGPCGRRAPCRQPTPGRSCSSW